MTGAAKGTVLKLLADVGQSCAEYQDKTLRNLPCKRVQCDEIWSFCYAKDKNVPEDKQGQFGYGDVWTFTAICADSKVVLTWRIGSRNIQDSYRVYERLGRAHEKQDTAYYRRPQNVFRCR